MAYGDKLFEDGTEHIDDGEGMAICGYPWLDCKGGWGNGMLVAAGVKRLYLNDVIKAAAEIMAMPDGKMSTQNFMLSSIFMGGNMIVQGANPVYEGTD